MTPVRILIVEDEAITSMHLQTSLRRLGYVIAGMVDRGDDAVRLATQLCPDLILMDIGLRGEMDGIQTAAYIRRLCQIPVVFLTAHADSVTLERAKIVEPLGYLIKPFQENTLQATVEMALYKYHMDNLLRESEARYHAVVDQIADAVLLVELYSHRLLEANSAALEMLDLTIEEIADTSLTAVLHDSFNGIEDQVRTASPQSYFHMGVREYRPNKNRVLMVDLRASLVHYSQQDVLCIVMHDITDRKQYEAQMLQTNEELKTRLSEIEQLHAELRESAIRDPLTGLFNRRYLHELIQREFSRAVREDYEISLVMLDVDNFKQINDTHGHLAGDKILQIVGAKLRNFCRLEDLMFRYGGDEFLMVLYRTSLEDARKRVQQLLEDVQSLSLDVDGLTMGISLSAGLATSVVDGKTIDALIRLADNALYRAKAAGRNRVMD